MESSKALSYYGLIICAVVKHIISVLCVSFSNQLDIFCKTDSNILYKGQIIFKCLKLNKRKLNKIILLEIKCKR